MSHAKVAPLSRGGLKHDVIHANAGLFCDENISMDDVITIVLFSSADPELRNLHQSLRDVIKSAYDWSITLMRSRHLIGCC